MGLATRPESGRHRHSGQHLRGSASRLPGSRQQPPVLIDEFVAGTLMLRAGLFEDERHKDADLDAFLKKIAGSSGWGFNVGRKTNLLQQIWDRRYQDQVKLDAFVKKGPKVEGVARGVIGEAIAAYAGELQEREVVDFALLEHEVFTRLVPASSGNSQGS